MDEFKKFTEELKAKIAEAIKTTEYQKLLKEAKDSNSGTFEVVISTDDVDRSGEIIDQKGWDFTNYLQNPIVLWAHDYSMLPIGICESIETIGNKTIAKGRFAPESCNPFAQQVRQLYDLKMLNTTSVGLIVREADGNVITKAELLEFSFVPVPANPYALSLAKAKELNIDIEMLRAKGINFDIKEADAVETPPAEGADPKEGDACTLDDGNEGMMVMVDGELICQPKAAEEKGAVADEMTADEMMEKKWENCDQVYEIVGAFLDVYLNQDTPVEQFPELLTEAANLLLALAKNPAEDEQPTEGKIFKAKQEKNADLLKMLLARFEQKTGQRLSKTSTDQLTEMLTQLKQVTGALESFISNEETQGADEGKSIGDKPDDIKRSKTAKADEALLKSLDFYLTQRQVLRAVTNSLQKALENVNDKIRVKSN